VNRAKRWLALALFCSCEWMMEKEHAGINMSTHYYASTEHVPMIQLTSVIKSSWVLFVSQNLALIQRNQRDL
jgi:hypothetical protein